VAFENKIPAPKGHLRREFDLPVRRSRCGLAGSRERDSQGDRVIEYTGVPVSEKWSRKRPPALFRRGGARAAARWSPRWNRARYINAFLPGRICEATVRKKRVFIRACAHIRAARSSPSDYGKDYFDNFIQGSCRLHQVPGRM